MTTLNLMAHCGAKTTTREEVRAVETPDATDTWFPIPHRDILHGIEGQLQASGLSIVNEAHVLDKDGNRYFGLLQVQNGEQAKDYSLVVGIRNSHDKAFSAGIVVGSGVFVCDNLAFSGEIKLARKHTRNIGRDLSGLVNRAVGRLGNMRERQALRIDAYKRTELGDLQAHDLIVRSMDSGVISGSAIPKVLREYREPRHAEFREGKTAWRMFNAFTEVLKESNLFERPRRTQALHGIMDTVSGVALLKN